MIQNMEQCKLNHNALNPRYVDVLDGIRAAAILLIVWFHIWQQSWLMPVIRLPFLTRLGLPATISFDCLPRSGFLFVDMMLLISAFCLFLPHARSVFCGEEPPKALSFYKKRIVRIVPPYYLSVLVIFFCFALPSGTYVSAKWMWTDLLSTLTFTQTFIPGVLLGTSLNGVLWTAAVEMQFYLLFPLLAYCFRRKPILTYLGMVSVSMVYLQLFALSDIEGLRVTLNQLPGFLGVFANGMLAAYGYVWLTTKTKRTKWLSTVSTLVAFGCIWLIVYMIKDVSSISTIQFWQASHRYVQSVVFTLFLLSSAFAARWYRFVFHNRAAVFLAAISYNLYIWHQWLAVKLKAWHIPYWSGEQAPNFTGDHVWQMQYTFIAFVGGLLLATLLTYCFEIPVTTLLLRRIQPTRKGLNHATPIQDK